MASCKRKRSIPWRTFKVPMPFPPFSLGAFPSLCPESNPDAPISNEVKPRSIRPTEASRIYATGWVSNQGRRITPSCCCCRGFISHFSLSSPRNTQHHLGPLVAGAWRVAHLRQTRGNLPGENPSSKWYRLGKVTTATWSSLTGWRKLEI